MKNVFHFILISVLVLFLICCSSKDIKEAFGIVINPTPIKIGKTYHPVYISNLQKSDNISSTKVLNDLRSHLPVIEASYEPNFQQSNKLSVPQEIQKLTTSVQPYIDETVKYIPRIESTGIIVDNVYLDSTPPLLIIELSLKKVDEKKLNRLISKAKQNQDKLANGLQLLGSIVSTAKGKKIGRFSIDTVQLRLSPIPPFFVSTRLKYASN